MNETLTTRQLRLVVLLGLVVLLAGGYWAVTRHKSSSPTTSPSTPAHTTVAPTTPTPSKSHTHSAAAPKLATHGLPAAVARAKQKHSVVVVSLYSPAAGLDRLANAEAKAGAAASGAGYVAVDVLHQRAGLAILHKLGLVDTPAVLVIGRRHSVSAELKGFVDRNVVAQAVSDAR